LKTEYLNVFLLLQVLKNSAILGVVEGGYSVEERGKSAKYLANSPVFGYVIDGLHTNGPDVEQLTLGDIKPILEESLVIENKAMREEI
jgi:queuine tRNA-ribosyltransferase subunit QTRTD1